MNLTPNEISNLLDMGSKRAINQALAFCKEKNMSFDIRNPATQLLFKQSTEAFYRIFKEIYEKEKLKGDIKK